MKQFLKMSRFSSCKKLKNARKFHSRIFVNMGWLLFDHFFRMGFGFVIGVFVIRYLGPEQFGIFAFVLAFVGLFGSLANLGLNEIVVRDIVNTPSQRDEIVGTAFILKLTGGIISIGVSFVFLVLFISTDRLILHIFGLIVLGLVLQSFDVIGLFFQSELRSKYVVCSRNCAFLISGILKIVLIRAAAPITAFALVYLVDIVLGICGLIISYWKQGLYLTNWKISFSKVKRMLKLSWPNILSGLSIAVYMKIDKVMIANIVNTMEVGVYSAASRISESLYFIPTIVGISTYPSLVRVFNKSEDEYYEKTALIMGYFFWFGILVSVTVVLLSKQIVNFLYGEMYSSAAGILSVHIFSYVIVGMSIIFSKKFVLDGTTKISFYGTIVGAAINFIINLFLIPRYGGFGAAIATVVAYSVPMVFQTIFFDRKIGKTFLVSIFYPLYKSF